MATAQIPILRQGRVYESLDTSAVRDLRTGEVLAQMSLANAGLIRRDGRNAKSAFNVLQNMSCDDLLRLTEKAAELFLHGILPLGSTDHMQSPQDYIATLSRTSGLPHNMVQANMHKIHHVMANIRKIMDGLTRGLDLSVLDRGYGEHDGVAVSYFPAAHNLGAVLPSNSPGVHSLWVPAVALKIPLVIKPGSEEPWSPWRIIQAYIAAGVPRQAFSFYPTTHEGSQAVIEQSQRILLFGDQKTVQQHRNNPAVSVHGPGYSKVIIGEDEIDRWPEHLDILVQSVLANGGRSCINASAIVVPRHADELADALARRLAAVQPTEPDDPAAQLSAFANANMAEWIDNHIAALLDDDEHGNAIDITAQYRTGSRLVRHGHAYYVLPTVVRCQSMSHPLANTEFLFPYCSVVQLPQEETLQSLGPSLVVSAITHDPDFRRQLLACPHIDRLNLGAMPTCTVQWDQPHEGNLFEFLYRRRAIALSGV